MTGACKVRPKLMSVWHEIFESKSAGKVITVAVYAPSHKPLQENSWFGLDKKRQKKFETFLKLKEEATKSCSPIPDA